MTTFKELVRILATNEKGAMMDKEAAIQTFISSMAEAGNKAMSEAPEVLQEYLQWQFIEHIVYAVISAVIMVLLVVYYRHIISAKGDGDLEDYIMDHFGRFVMIVVAAFFSIVAPISLAVDTYSAIKIKLAPKVYMIDQMK